ncbi:hypothetical protein FHL15_009003 [Xylaria flabelliformis]|uniref:Uncharacterized protein n=1 Tax=Xylaria flabelliformis TaxID=2512241 RepID=A0A553HQ46_9PEZI|nr:hypothetical protein FHL15_009003 [Xylaria flabelliformis]
MIDVGPLAPTHASSKLQFPVSTARCKGDALHHRDSLPASSLRRRSRCSYRFVRMPRFSAFRSMPRTGDLHCSANLDRTTQVRRTRLTSQPHHLRFDPSIDRPASTVASLI